MAELTANINFPIDLVYLWVDGNDPEWQAKRNRYLDAPVVPTGEGAEAESVVSVAEARWRECDELKYSLRSVEKFAPWINRIFIVTDGQCPSWLSAQHPKIRIVDHSEILDAEALPVFSSHAIESCIYRIPELSEHFIVGNDDTLFAAPVTPDVFFKNGGQPIVRLVRFNRRKALNKGNYTRVLYRMQNLVNERIGTMIPYAPHHNFDAYRKSDFEYCVNLMREAWRETSFRRFRHDDDMQRCFVSLYAIASQRAEMRKVGRYNRIDGFMQKFLAFVKNRYASDSRCIPLTHPDFNKVIVKYNPLMFCMNDDERAADKDRERMVAFLDRMFPTKSSFEK